MPKTGIEAAATGRASWPAAVVVAFSLVAAGANASFYFVNHYATDAHDLAINGVCETTSGSGLCTLRAAAEEAAASAADDTIFLGTGSILLELDALPEHTPGQGSLTLVGNGLLSTQIAGDPDLDAGMITTSGELEIRDTRIFLFRSDVRSAITVELAGTLVAESVYFSGNRSGTSGASIHGEGSSAIAVRDSFFTVGEGLTGEISAFGSSFACDRCLFLGGQGNIGGAVAVGDDFGPIQARIERSTFEDNRSISGGGAIFALLASPSSSLLVLNTTITGNSTEGHGGGIWSSGQNVFIQNSTIAGNTANSELLGGERGGGIAVEPGSAVNIANSIVSGNRRCSAGTHQEGCTAYSGDDCRGSLLSNGFNLVQAVPATHCTVSGGHSVAEPQLIPLAYAGGSMPVLALPATSPARNAGNPAGCLDGGSVLLHDQRGAPRPAPGVGICDLGAFEYGALIFDDDFEPSFPRWSGYYD